MPLRNYYAILGVPNFSSMDVVKQAYRAKAKRCHPDLGGDPNQFKLINHAWERLKVCKTNYDLALRQQVATERCPRCGFFSCNMQQCCPDCGHRYCYRDERCSAKPKPSLWEEHREFIAFNIVCISFILLTLGAFS